MTRLEKMKEQMTHDLASVQHALEDANAEATRLLGVLEQLKAQEEQLHEYLQVLDLHRWRRFVDEPPAEGQRFVSFSFNKGFSSGDQTWFDYWLPFPEFEAIKEEVTDDES